MRSVRPRLIIMGMAAALVAALAGCGQAQPGANIASSSQSQILGQAHPSVVEPIAGATSAPAHHAAAPTSTASTASTASTSARPSTRVLPQPVSLNVVRQQLAQSGISANPDVATLTPGGLAVAPVGAPAAVQEIINAGNQIATLQYLWGGGHGAFEDYAYDCSGSVSFVLAAAHLLGTTETSGQFMSYGKPGPGKWVTIFATSGHVYMYVAGLRFDTVALAEYGSRWTNKSADDGGSFVARHPVGL
jgi:cell wall-associated NlpC family hydrolase